MPIPNSAFHNPENPNEEDEYCRVKLEKLVEKIKRRFLQEIPSNDALVKAANMGITRAALENAMKNAWGDTAERYTNTLCKWLREAKKITPDWNKEIREWWLTDQTTYATVSKPMNFIVFLREALSLPPGMDIRIIGTWPPSIVGKENQAARDLLNNLVERSNSVRMLQPRPDSRFYAKRLYTQHLEDDEDERERNFNASKEDLFTHLEKLHRLKRDLKNPEKFDFRLYDDSPGMRMFAHGEYIYVSHLLDHLGSNETFSTVYANDGSDSARQLLDHFDHIWKSAAEYQGISNRERFNLQMIGKLAGIYKVFNYCHKLDQVLNREIPATQIGALKIHPNGFIEQRTYRGDTEDTDRNEGWALLVGSNLLMEVRNVRSPKFTAFSIIRRARGFEGLPGQYLFGTLIVPKKRDSNPTALRVILQRQTESTKLDDIECTKIAIKDLAPAEKIPPTVRRFLSGVFRNMLRFRENAILNDASLEEEMNHTKVKLGRVMAAYAKVLQLENAEMEDIVSALRWALTHGYRNWERIQKEFGDTVTQHEGLAEIFARIKIENPSKK
ncbi:MAG: hypothetical protein EPGJADBJ_03499 [Saprospiraceae bacterium]|nr:hypothetical protein [Saprospiraceae bacterium]